MHIVGDIITAVQLNFTLHSHLWLFFLHNNSTLTATLSTIFLKFSVYWWIINVKISGTFSVTNHSFLSHALKKKGVLRLWRYQCGLFLQQQNWRAKRTSAFRSFFTFKTVNPSTQFFISCFSGCIDCPPW